MFTGQGNSLTGVCPKGVEKALAAIISRGCGFSMSPQKDAFIESIDTHGSSVFASSGRACAGGSVAAYSPNASVTRLARSSTVIVMSTSMVFSSRRFASS
jgi:hypothetical protein